MGTDGSLPNRSMLCSWSIADWAEYPASSRNGRQVATSPESSISTTELRRTRGTAPISRSDQTELSSSSTLLVVVARDQAKVLDLRRRVEIHLGASAVE